MRYVDYSGQTIDGRYRIIRLLGEGGMGSVYLGEHVVIGKKAAVKFLHAEYVGEEDVVKRFYREAQAAASIGHKNIIDVLDVGVSQAGEPYMVMEYLEGESLSSLLDRTGPIDLAAACGILESALQALSAVHDKGIIHRDLKPDNIFLVCLPGEPPKVKLIDFGISKFTKGTEESQLTQTGSLLGTPSYMSPEQARSLPDIDFRTDLYSMGVILYQMLTGEMPFVGNHYNDLLIKLLTDPPRPPGVVYADFPKEAESLVMKTLEKDPADRHGSADEMLEAIKTLSSYDRREDRLTHYASGVAKKSFAGGDLGEKVGSGDNSNVASDVLAGMSRKSTPNNWVGTDAVARGRRGLYLGIVGAIVVVGIAVATLLYFFLEPDLRGNTAAVSSARDRREMTRQTAANSEPDTKEEGIQLEITGIPTGGKIYYDKALVPMNPFRVKAQKTLTQIKVTAAGFEDFITAIVPDRNQVVEVNLESKEKGSAGLDAPNGKKQEKKRNPSRSRRHRVKPNLPPSQPPTATHDESQKDEVRKSGKGTEFTEDFE
ncbi:MAG: serine/threonine protein kinase [Deltaproteobacteria bacterium]|nr:serine/threonine protein kinase [Deltaproteobacteria bacterium]